ncbi:hypothetical protein CTM88_06080 [Photobacterium aquimaris]|uniref:Dicarboxylate transport domain-containing protein n=1 Tax=Photobacterium aquimaris TaxID=512643 RepID=A0A2T3INW2_9GAMM|nr:YdbH domain-containing protein [Photobacterium aquimaris]OBU19846.1 hypothetical protein AYY20_17265 [Photobacterium aquimaris]PSU30040.1 hypothetical protein CTM88_06080 [Photobacterium aquimaris]
MKSCSSNTEPAPPANSRPPRLRTRTKLGLSLLVLLLLAPIVGFIWLSINGITVTGLKGLRYDGDVRAELISLRVFDYNVTFHNLSLRHSVDPDNPIDEGSYRLFAKKYEIELSPAATTMLEKQDIFLRYIHFFDATFKFVDFSSPLAINAHARKVTASAAHSDGKEPAATQIIEQVDVTISNSPHLVISGHSEKGRLNLFFPHYQPSPHYPLRFTDSQFSIGWQGDQTPVTVTIGALHPEWETLNNTLPEQIITKLSLAFDLKHSLPTMKLIAKTAKLEQPKYLPEFINRTDIDSKGFHLGQTIANLARLPINKFKIKSFTYGDLLIDAKVILETPLTATSLTTHSTASTTSIAIDEPTTKTVVNQASPLKTAAEKAHHKQQRQRREQARHKVEQQAKDLNIATENKTKARFIVRGKALAPNPYQLEVNIHHLSKTDARVHTIMTRSDGNSLNCDAKIIFQQPLPQYLNCNANFKNTKEFTDRLGLKDVPNAKINGPLRFYAKQIVSSLSKKAQPMVIDNKIVDAHYLVGIELPASFAIELNKYAFAAPFIHSKRNHESHQNQPKHVANIQMNSDGKINFKVNYNNDLFRVALSDKNETISFKNAKTKSALHFFIDDLNCLYPNLQCHIDANISASINSLEPIIDSKIDDVVFNSKVKATWANNYLVSQLQQTRLQAKKLTFAGIPTLANSSSKNIDFSLKQLIGIFEKQHDQLALTLYQPKNTQAQLSAQLYARHQTTKKSQAADYKTQLNVKVSKFLLRHAFVFNTQKTQSQPLTLSSDFKITMAAAQRNRQQVLPPTYLHGHFLLADNALNVETTLANPYDDILAQVDVDTDLITKKTTVKLHRRTISFTKENSLKNYYFPALSLPIDITDGSITTSASFVIDRNNQLTGTANIATNQLSGYYRGIKITQLNSSLYTAFSPKGIRSLRPMALFAQQLSLGVSLTKPSLIIDFDTQTDQYTLHRISANLFGGSISAHGIKRTNSRYLSTIPITVFGLNIEKVTDSIDHDGIEFTGILDGTIPISFIDGKPEIHAGVLQSRHPGGVLRYLDGSIIDNKVKAAGHHSPLMVSEILKNYHYRTLAIKVNYAREGVLDTQSHFKGYNPDFQYGRPININLAVEDNILELIKTINMINASDIEQKISDHFNQH